jgi:hypothetical protein
LLALSDRRRTEEPNRILNLEKIKFGLAMPLPPLPPLPYYTRNYDYAIVISHYTM